MTWLWHSLIRTPDKDFLLSFPYGICPYEIFSNQCEIYSKKSKTEETIFLKQFTEVSISELFDISMEL